MHGLTGVGVVVDNAQVEPVPSTGIDPDHVFRDAMDQVDEILIITSSRRDADGTITDFEYRYLNTAALHMMNRPAEDLIGRGLVELFPSHVPTGLFANYRDIVESGRKRQISIPAFDENGVKGSFDFEVFPFGDGYVMLGRDVTEQMTRESEMRESRQQFRLLAEHASDVVYRTDASGRFTWISPSIEAALGWSLADLIGTPSLDLIHVDDQDRILEKRAKVRGGTERVRVTARYRTKSGDYRWMAILASPVLTAVGEHDGMAVGLRDVHEQTIAETNLADSEAVFRSAVHSAAIGMAIVNSGGYVLEANRSLSRLLGHPRVAWEGTSVESFVHEDDRDRLRASMLGIEQREGSLVLSDLRLLHRSGTAVWTRCAVVALPATPARSVRFLVQVEDVTAERQARADLEYQALHDSLTGLRNRLWILDILPSELQAAKRTGRHVGLLLVDLDQFKVVNDSLGHTAGDELLIQVAERLQAAVPTSCHLGRSGGDEFIILAPDVTSASELETVAHAILEGLSSTVLLSGHQFVPAASIGISMSTARSTSESMLRDADAALFRAKAGGRNRWQFSDEDMHRHAVARMVLVEEISAAIAQRQFVAHYMPIVSFADGTVAGHEALVRWRHPSRGVLPPSEFLGVAEETGLISGLGDLVLDDVCRYLSEHPGDTRCMSVNVSAVQLGQPDWAASFRSTLDRYGVPPERLVIEVTETAVLSAMSSTLADLRGLRDIGVGLHLDDFGTGYSPISLLRDLPVTGIKLDASFVQDVTATDRRTAAIVSGLAALVRRLGLVGIAEGVETSQQADVVAAAGWEHAQGYLYGRPAPEPVA